MELILEKWVQKDPQKEARKRPTNAPKGPPGGTPKRGQNEANEAKMRPKPFDQKTKEKKAKNTVNMQSPGPLGP